MGLSFIGGGGSGASSAPRVADIPRPFVIPHRGGGGFIAPENVFDGFRVGASLNMGIIDGGDWTVSSDDTLVCNHDTTVDFLTTSTGNASDYSAMALSQLVVDTPSWFGGTFPTTRMMNDAEFFKTFGGLIPFAPEPKVARAADLLAQRIKSLGLQQSVLPTSFTRAWLTPFLTVGCTDVMILASSMPAPATRAEYLSAGIKWIGVDYAGTITPANAQTLKDEGFKLNLYTVNRKVDLSTPNNWASVIGIFDAFTSDDPLYFHHAIDATKVTRYRRTTDPFKAGTYYHGHYADGDINPTHRGTFKAGRWVQASFGYIWTLQGWACPLANPGAYNLDFTFTFDAVGSDATRWAGIWFGAADDRKYADSGATTENGYQFFFRANGQLNLNNKIAGVVTAGTSSGTSAAISAPLTTSADLASGVAVTAIPVAAIPTALASGAKFALPTGQTATLSAAASAGATSISVTSVTPTALIPSGSSLPQSATFRIAVTSTTVTVTRTDVSPTVAVSKTSADHRGPYFSFAHLTNALGMITSVSDVTVS